MICPQCKQDSISFWKVWLKGGLGRYACPSCGGSSRIRISVPLSLFSFCLFGLAAVLGLLFAGWFVLSGAIILALVIDAGVDYRFRSLVPASSGQGVTIRLKQLALPLGACLGVAAIFLGGVKLGERFSRNQFEVAKLFSTTQADEYLAAGKPAKAVQLLHFAKAFEEITGSTDALLGKAYLADGEPCLAQAFAESHLRYMERNKLTSFSSYGTTIDFDERASVACSKFQSANRSTVTDAKP
jgi:hypothetical protein